jgi:hypothetical protein
MTQQSLSRTILCSSFGVPSIPNSLHGCLAASVSSALNFDEYDCWSLRQQLRYERFERISIGESDSSGDYQAILFLRTDI